MSQITNLNSGLLDTLTGSTDGGAVSPAVGNITLVAGTGISIVGNPGAHTLTISNTGNIPAIFLANNGSATPVGNTLLIVGVGNITTTGSGAAISISLQNITNNAVLVGGVSNAIQNIPLTNGQLVIGSSGNIPVAGNITSSDNTLTITNGGGTIDLSVNGGGTPWTTVTANKVMAPNNGYITAGSGQLLMLLPVVSSVGDEVHIVDSGQATTNSPWRITQRAGQQIFANLSKNTTNGAGGYLEVIGGSTDAKYSTIVLRCIVADTFWVVDNARANLSYN